MVNVIYTLQIKLDGRKNRGNSKLLECSQKKHELIAYDRQWTWK